MKTKTNTFLAVTAVLAALIFSAYGKDELPVGSWMVGFANGVVEECTIAADGKVTVSEEGRSATGVAKFSDGVVEIRYDDSRLEHWTERDGEMVVEYWHPASRMEDPKWIPVMGVAEAHVESGLEVHEWGTFTVLQGSDGGVIGWYQAPDQLVDLPHFVQRAPFTLKSGTMWGNGLMDTIRMETPVLYFYPEKEMDVTVSASFRGGRITEVFPPVAGGQSLWRGTLLPPDSAELAKVPRAGGAPGRHYAAARAVPDAWLFRNKPMPRAKGRPLEINTSPGVMAVRIEPIDHFIFYRGAGTQSYFEISAKQMESPGTFRLTNNGQATIPKLFAVHVADGKSSWVAVDELKQSSWDKEAKVYLNRETITFPEPAGSVGDVALELKAGMIATLHAEGLTQAEAAAMVATWDDLWFTEPGTRVLAVLPQSFADSMVPLKIAPRPEKLERVFVARIEMISREDEAVLTAVLNPALADDEALAADAKRLGALQLGRYAAGGMERARELVSREMQSRFSRLIAEREKQEKSQAAAE